MLKTVFIMLMVGNFGWAAVHGQIWDTAIERSYFQGLALFVVWIAQLVKLWSEPKAEDWTPPKGPFRKPKRGDPDFVDTIDG